MEKILAFIAIVVISIIMAITHGWALSITWGWLIVPLFGLPVLNIPQAIGVMFIVSFVAKNTGDVDKSHSPTELLANAIGRAIIHPPLLVLSCWVVTKFI